MVERRFFSLKIFGIPDPGSSIPRKNYVYFFPAPGQPPRLLRRADVAGLLATRSARHAGDTTFLLSRTRRDVPRLCAHAEERTRIHLAWNMRTERFAAFDTAYRARARDGSPGNWFFFSFFMLVLRFLIIPVGSRYGESTDVIHRAAASVSGMKRSGAIIYIGLWVSSRDDDFWRRIAVCLRGIRSYVGRWKCQVRA